MSPCAFDLCQYELAEGEVISLPGSLNDANIDLRQFKTPCNDAPPYALPNHLGMAYAALLTTDLASDLAFLQSQGVAFLSHPYGIPGDQFVFLRDPDGVLYKLMETAPPHGDPDRNMHLIAMPYIGVNVSDFDRSLAFYQALGYTEARPLPERAPWRRPVPTAWADRSASGARTSPSAQETNTCCAWCNGWRRSTTKHPIRRPSTASP